MMLNIILRKLLSPHGEFSVMFMKFVDQHDQNAQNQDKLLVIIKHNAI